MRPFGVLLIVLACSIAFAQPAQPKKGQPPQPPAGIKALRDVEYVQGGSPAQKLDVYFPEKAEAPASAEATAGKPLPLIVWIHGGAWMAGDKAGGPFMGEMSRGYVVASVNYRLSGEAKWPTQLYDCKAAIRFLRANAKQYNIDPNRIGIWGSSAGGHLVAMLGTTGDVKELEGDLGNPGVSSRVQAVCDWFGPTDFLQIGKFPSNLKHDAADSPEAKLLGGAIHDNEEKAKTANPIAYVTKDDPPFLIMHGDKDMTVPFNQSELLNEALKKAGVWVKFEPVKGAGHGFGGPEVMKIVDQFFDEKLKGSK